VLSSDPDQSVPREAAFIKAPALAVLTTALVAVLGSWGGSYMFCYQLVWAYFSFYAFFVFVAGSIAWSPRTGR
jgi:hypothetical protein